MLHPYLRTRLITLVIFAGFLTQSLLLPVAQAGPGLPAVAARPPRASAAPPPAPAVAPRPAARPAALHPAAGPAPIIIPFSSSRASAAPPRPFLSSVKIALPDLGGCNPSNGTGACQNGLYPISVPSGDFWHSFSDLAVPGRGPALQFMRTYNSVLAHLTHQPSSPFGNPGWTDNYNMRLGWTCTGNFLGICIGDQRWVVNQENASMALFSDSNSPNYPALDGAHATLISDTSGVFIFTRLATQERFFFHACVPAQDGGTQVCGSTTDPVAGKLERIIDRNNYTTTLSYTATGTLAGFLNTVTDPAGRQLQMSYGQVGTAWLRTGVQDFTGRQVAFTYDANLDLRTASDVAGQVTSFTYDASHQLLTMADPRTGTVTNGYAGTTGQVISQTDALSRTLLFEYDTPNCPGFLQSQTVAVVTDTLGFATTYTTPCTTYGGDNRILQVTHNPGRADTATWAYAYDDPYHPYDRTGVQDPYGRVSTTSFDANGNVAGTTDPLNQTTAYLYDATSNLLTITNTLGITTSFTYDAQGNLLSVTRPLTQTGQLLIASLGYDATHPGDLTSLRDPRGNIWHYSHDATYGYVVSSTNPLTETASATYDTLGRLASATTPKTHTAALATPPTAPSPR